MEYLVLVAVYGDRDDLVLLLAVECCLILLAVTVLRYPRPRSREILYRLTAGSMTLREDAGTLLCERCVTKLVPDGRRTALYPDLPALGDVEGVLPVLVDFVNSAHYS
nr:hypothetical protein [Natronomonas sp. LN261]